jgi:hypothetical protein
MELLSNSGTVLLVLSFVSMILAGGAIVLAIAFVRIRGGAAQSKTRRQTHRGGHQRRDGNGRTSPTGPDGPAGDEDRRGCGDSRFARAAGP